MSELLPHVQEVIKAYAAACVRGAIAAHSAGKEKV